MVLSYWLLNNLNLSHAKIVFVESWCRVTSLSTTGRILRWFAHELVVHWEDLSKAHPDFKYHGPII